MTLALQRFLHYGIICLLILAPTQWSTVVFNKTHLTLADPLMGLLALAGGWVLFVRRDGQRSIWPSPYVLAFICFGVISIPGAFDRGEALKDVVQWILYFVVGWMLFRYALSEIKTSRTALLTAALVAVFIVGFSFLQFLRRSIPDMGVCATFGNRNVLAGFLALIIPFGYAHMLNEDNPYLKIAGFVFTLLGIVVLLSGAGALAVFAGLAAMAALRSRGSLAVTLLFIAVVVWLLHPNLPRRIQEEADPWLDSIALHDIDGELSRRYPEWESAWLMMTDHPLRGVGAGNYQARISSYRRIPTPPGAPEPDTQNLYLVLGASIGLPGLLAFAGLILEGLRNAAQVVMFARETSRERTLALGAFGGLLAFSIIIIWHPLLVRGIGLPFAGVLALSQHLRLKFERSRNF